MEMIVKKINRIERIKQEICHGADEKGVGKENTSLSVRVVGAHVLDGEIFALKAEGQELGTKFGEWGNIFSKLYERDENKLEFPGASDDTKTLESSMNRENQDNLNSIASIERKGSSDEEDLDNIVTAGEEKGHTQESRQHGLERFQEITLTLKEIAVELEIAVENEDYDEAAVLDEKLQILKSELESVGCPDAVMDSELDVESNKYKDKAVLNDNKIMDEAENLEKRMAGIENNGGEDLKDEDDDKDVGNDEDNNKDGNEADEEDNKRDGDEDGDEDNYKDGDEDKDEPS